MSPLSPLAGRGVGGEGLTFATQVNPTGTRVYTTTLGDGQNAFVVHTTSSWQLTVDSSQPAVASNQPTTADQVVSGPERTTGNWQLTTGHSAAVDQGFGDLEQIAACCPQPGVYSPLVVEVFSGLVESMVQDTTLGQAGVISTRGLSDPTLADTRDPALLLEAAGTVLQKWESDDHLSSVYSEPDAQARKSKTIPRLRVGLGTNGIFDDPTNL